MINETFREMTDAANAFLAPTGPRRLVTLSKGLIGCVLAVLFGAAARAETYYLNVSESGGSYSCWTTPGNWYTSVKDKTGTPATEFSSADDFIVPPQSTGYTLRTPTTTTTWTGKSLQVGGDDYSSKNSSIAVIRHCVRNNGTSVTYANDGLILARRSRYIAYYSGLNTVCGKVTVTGDSAYPATLRSSNANEVTLQFADAFSGEASAYVVVDSDKTNFVATLNNAANYRGAVCVTNFVYNASVGRATQLRLASDLPGSIRLTPDTSLALDGSSAITVGNLDVTSDVFIDIGLASLAVTGTFTRVAPVRIVVDASRFPATCDLIKGPKGLFTLADFDLVDQDGNPLAVDKLELAETADGITLRATTYPEALLTESDEKSRTVQYASSMTNASHWSNAAAWSDSATMPFGYKYIVRKGDAAYLRTPYEGTLTDPQSDYTFPGAILQVENDAMLINLNPTFTCARLILDEGTIGSSVYVDSTFEGRMEIRENGGTISQYTGVEATIAAEISGSGDLKVSAASGSASSTPQGYVRLSGLNTNFTGSVLVTIPVYTPADPVKNDKKITPRFDRNYMHLRVSDKRNLGGALAAANPKALTLENMCRLELAEGCTALTLDEPTRGIFVNWVGRLLAETDETLTIASPLAVNGTLWKEGDGRLVLANPAPTFGADATATEPTGDATNHLLRVAGGELKIGSVDAVNGLDVVFTNGAERLVLDLAAETGDFATYGTRNVKTDHPFAVEGDLTGIELHFESTQIPSENCTRAVFTVKKACYEAVAALFAKRTKSAAYRGWKISLARRDNDDGTTATMVATVERAGTVLLLR